VPAAPASLPGDGNLAARAILFVLEPDRPSDPDPVFLIKTFQLTRREASLAVLLARGIDLDDTASRMGIGVGTARGYMKQIFAKTDIHRQAELVALLLRRCVHFTCQRSDGIQYRR
jgi:DNA-binding CsgD family transcriptional regulator